MKNKVGRAGFTLLEVAIGTSMLTVIAGSAVLAMNSLSDAFRTGTTLATLDSSGRSILDQICEGLQATSSDNVSPTPQTPFSSTQVDFQRGIGTQNGAIVWGPPERIQLEYSPADPDDGQDNNANGLIDECRVVWITDPGQAGETRLTLSNNVAEYLEGEGANGLDDNDNTLIDERGLSFDFGTDSVTIRLTIQDVDPTGFHINRTVQRTMAFRNQGVAP